MKRLIGLFIIIFVTVSCERSSDPIYDIIEPLDYFPVYPGSWWKYTINDTLISIDSVSKEYQLHSYQTSPEGYSDANGKLVREFSDPVYVPFFNSRPIYGYEKIEWVRPPFGDYYMKWPYCRKRQVSISSATGRINGLVYK